MHAPQHSEESTGPAPQAPKNFGERVERTVQGFNETFVVFKSSNYTLYWLASFCYYVGLFTDQFARGYLGYTLTGSAMGLGAVVVSQGFPQAAISVLGGTLADRFPKRTLLLGAQLVLGVCGAILVGLLLADVLEVWHLVALSVIKGLAIGLSLPARLSFVSEVVPTEQFSRGYGLYYVALNTMRIGGPGVGGAVTGLWGIESAIIIITVAEFLGFLFLLPVYSEFGAPKKEAQEKSPLLKDIWATFVFARNTPTILVLMGAEIGLVFFSFSATQLMPVFALGLHNVGEVGLGTLLAVLGAGGLAGSFLAAVFGGIKRKPLMLLGDGMLLGAVLVIFANAPSFELMLILAVPVGIVQAIYTTFNSTLFQVSAPPEMRGRAMGLYSLGQLLQPVGVVPISFISDTLGVRMAVTVAGSLLIVHMLATLVLFPSFRNRRV